MISRVTIFSLLFALLLAAGLVRWNVAHRDECAHYLAGERGARPTVMVTTGTRQVEMPCSVWLPRQSGTIQILCFVDFGLAVVFLMNALADLQRMLQARRARGT